jgi:hypothetical protein
LVRELPLHCKLEWLERATQMISLLRDQSGCFYDCLLPLCLMQWIWCVAYIHFYPMFTTVAWHGETTLTWRTVVSGD